MVVDIILLYSSSVKKMERQVSAFLNAVLFFLIHYYFHRRTGSTRPTIGPAKPRDRHASSVLARSKRKPPRGMYINHDDLVIISSDTPQNGEVILKALDREIVSLKRQVR